MKNYELFLCFVVNQKHLPAKPQSSTLKSGEDDGTRFEVTSAGSDEETGFEFTSLVMMRETRRTIVTTVEGVIIDVAIIQDD